MKWAMKLLQKAEKAEELRKNDPIQLEQIQEDKKELQDFIENQEKIKEQDPDNYDPDGNDLDDIRERSTNLDNTLEECGEAPPIREQLCMVAFMLVFSLMMIMVTRGEATYFTMRANIDPATGASWISDDPNRVVKFEQIDTLELLGDWAQVLALELYSQPACRVASGQEVTAAKCRPHEDNEYRVHEVKNWNVAFMNTTFVRLTIQPACYVKNTAARWKYGARYIRSRAMDTPCAVAPCFDESDKKEDACSSAIGDEFDVNKLLVAHSYVNPQYYNYSKAGKLGPYKLNGGVTVSLGNSMAEALEMLEKLKSDLWFSKQSASLVFDYLTYNGNLDLFTHTVLSFSLLTSGKVFITKDQATFPMNIENAGGPFHTSRVVILVLFWIYVVQVVYFLVDAFVGLAQQQAKSKRLGHPFYYFVIAYYKPVWNRSDSLSLIITVVNLTIYIGFMLDDFRLKYEFSINPTGKYQVPLADAQKLDMPAEVDPSRLLADDWYLFSRFETITDTFGLYLTLAALNAFFIAVKVVKYANAVKKFTTYARTLSEGSTRMLNFSIVITLLLIGWTLYFLVMLGVHEPKMGNLPDAFMTCFHWILGDFPEMEAIVMNGGILAIASFILFQTMMFFICLNMFLAAMLNTYSETVGKIELSQEKKRMEEECGHKIIAVEYADKDELKADLTIKKDEIGTVWVQGVNEVGKAAKAGVTGGGPGIGNMIIEVNGERQEWKEHPTEADIFEDGIQPDVHDNLIHLQFKAPNPKPKGYLQQLYSKILREEESKEWAGIKPTVKTFWRAHGAVAFTLSEVIRMDRNVDDDEQKEEEAEEEKEPEADDEKAAPAQDSGIDRYLRVKIKKKLDSYLFSRGGTDAKKLGLDGGNGEGEEAMPGEDVKFEEDLEIDALRSRIEEEAITGDEVWLDCLMTQIEHEMEDDSIITELLRTADMVEGRKGQGPAKQDSVHAFYRTVYDILTTLECKAKTKWYKCLQDESKERLELLQKQNNILHDYVCELETRFMDIMQKLASFKGKKDGWIKKLAGLLDEGSYGHMDPNAPEKSTAHTDRLQKDWPHPLEGKAGKDQWLLENLQRRYGLNQV